uniref:Long-chain-alcohol oxidase n=1 Tax=Paramoeba aestuarina TaxID=180227 RepID=A0A7S4KQ91_9EUKA
MGEFRHREFTAEERRAVASCVECVVQPLTQKEEDDLVVEYADKLQREGLTREQTEAEIRAFAQRGTKDIDIVNNIESTVRKRLCPTKFGEFSQLLGLLSSRIGALILCGGVTPFVELSKEQRMVVFWGWGNSSFEMIRNIHKIFKNLSLRAFFTIPNMNQDGRKWNVNWGVVGFPGADPEINSERYTDSLKQCYDFGQNIITISQLREKEKGGYDAVVMGSGCGGGLVVGKLVSEGKRVLVVEKGKYVRPEDMTLLEEDANNDMFENGGLVSSNDGNIQFLAGSCLGGGSLVNWSCSLITPEAVRREWAEEYGLTHVTTKDFSDSIEDVMKTLNMHQNHNLNDSEQNKILMEGAKRLGMQYMRAAQNVVGDHNCGWCSLGCRFTEKQSTTATYLKTAAEQGKVDFLVETTALRVTHKHRKVTGVEVRDKDGEVYTVPVKVAVASCGALQTPLLLRRSGLKHPAIGKNLRIHPVSVVDGVFPRKINPWEGPIMTSVATSLERQRGSEYGCRIETPAAQTMVAISCLPSSSPLETKKAWLNYPYRSNLIVLVRDSGSGTVTENEIGGPSIDYTINDHDIQSLKSGLFASARMLIEAGAEEIGIRSSNAPTLKVPKNPDSLKLVTEWFEELENLGAFRTNQIGIFTAHQMGTARMASHPTMGPVSPTGETFEVKGLFVADTSLFPTPSGTNPMLTCYSLCHQVAPHVVEEVDRREKEGEKRKARL